MGSAQREACGQHSEGCLWAPISPVSLVLRDMATFQQNTVITEQINRKSKKNHFLGPVFNTKVTLINYY